MMMECALNNSLALTDFFKKLSHLVIDIDMNYGMRLQKTFTISIIAITNLPVGMLLLRYAHRILLIILWNE